MKRKLSLVLAFVMILSLVPMSAFAASDNSVDGVLKVKNDENLAAIGAPLLKLENDGGDWADKEIILLQVENADWLDNGDAKKGGTIANFAAELETEIEAASKKTVGTDVYGVEATVERESDSRIRVTLEGTTNTTVDGKEIAKDLVVKIPLWVEMDGEVGKVTIESKSGKITEETLVFANGRSGETTVTIDDTTTFGTTKTIESIRIEENAIGAIDIADTGEKYIKLSLDKDFEFIIDEAKITGDLVKNSPVDLDSDNKFYDLDDDELKIFVRGTKSGATDGIELKAQPEYAADIVISGLKVKPTKDAKDGKVNMTVSSDMGEIKTTKLEIGEYADYKVNVTADGDPKEIFSGRYEGASKDNKYSVKLAADQPLTVDEEHELQTLIIDEKVEGSWTDNKPVVVEFPTWVKIIGVDKDGDEKDAIKNEAFDANEYEFEMDSTKVNGKKKVELTFYVSVEAGKAGDIEAKVGGRGLDDEYEVVLGKAVAPVKVEAEVAPIKAGIRDQEIGKITITENEEGAILENKDIVLELDKDMEWDDEPKVEVVKGDLEIDEDDIDVKDNILTIHVDDESTEPSVIEITEGRVKVDRSIAEGKIDVEVKGSALIQNGYDKDVDYKDATDEKIGKTDLLDDYGLFNNDYYAKVEVANVITPADQDTKGEPAKFVIGSTEYQVGEEVRTADVAPYIKDGRTMLSVRYVAEAMGVAEDSIVWDGVNRTVTIFKGDRIAQVTIGSNQLMVGGVAITMDTVAEIKDGRTMLPISFIAKALGAEVEWDGATRTVTVK